MQWIFHFYVCKYERNHRNFSIFSHIVVHETFFLCLFIRFAFNLMNLFFFHVSFRLWIWRFESPYRSTCNIPNSLSIKKYPVYGNANTPDSPRSTRSAPWSRSQQKGLFGVNSSPRSVRSASSRKNSSVPTHRVRSSSVDSHSSNDSKACKRLISHRIILWFFFFWFEAKFQTLEMLIVFFVCVYFI